MYTELPDRTALKRPSEELHTQKRQCLFDWLLCVLAQQESVILETNYSGVVHRTLIICTASCFIYGTDGVCITRLTAFWFTWYYLLSLSADTPTKMPHSFSSIVELKTWTWRYDIRREGILHLHKSNQYG